MICISVTPTSRKLAKVDILNAARNADMVELCLDHLAKEPDVADLLSATDKPVLVSCRRKIDGGQWEGDEEARLSLLRQAIAAEPAYVELELDIAHEIPRFGKTKRVISYSSYKPLAKVEEIFKQAKTVHADVVKFTWPTPSLEAAWPLLAAVTKKRDLPVVGLGIGHAGLTFSLLGLKYGSPWIYAALEKGMEVFPEQPTVTELDELFRFREITSNTRFVGVVGMETNRIAVRALNDGFRHLGIDTRCLPLYVGGRDRLGKMLEILKIRGMVLGPDAPPGLVDFADGRDEAADETGHADLMLHQSDGWQAYNLLWKSALKALEEAVGSAGGDHKPLDRRNVLCLGAGPLARTLAWGIQRRQGLLSIAAPDDVAAGRLAREMQARFVPFANLYDTLSDVVVIADPALKLGHHKTELNPSYLRESMTVLDVSQFSIGISDLLVEARHRGCKTVATKEVFTTLTATQFKSITGEDFPADVL